MGLSTAWASLYRGSGLLEERGREIPRVPSSWVRLSGSLRAWPRMIVTSSGGLPNAIASGCSGPGAWPGPSTWSNAAA